MSSSQKTLKFYKELKPEGLKKRTKESWDKRILADLKKKISKKQKILDMGCGYGRITVPLAKMGYNIEGVDIVPGLIADAREYAKNEKLKLKLKVGNMCNLDYKENTFDIVLCLWTAFNELLTEKEQVACIKGTYKILRDGGKAIFECPVYRPPTSEDIKNGNAHGKDHRLRITLIDGSKTEHYMHDEKSISRVIKKARIKKFRMYKEQFGRRERFFFEIEK